MGGEHTPEWVARSRVAGFRVIGFEPADKPITAMLARRGAEPARYGFHVQLIRLGPVALVLLGLAACGSDKEPAATASATHPACSRQAATDELKERGLLPRRENFEGAAAVVCHDFNGDGLEDMAFTRESGGSAYTIGWGILAAKQGGGWKLALFKPAAGEVLINASGDDLLRGAWKYRRQDGHCCPSGGFAIQRYSYDPDAGHFEKVTTSVRDIRPDRGQAPPSGFEYPRLARSSSKAVRMRGWPS